MSVSTQQPETDAAAAAEPSAFRFFRADAAEGMRPAHERGTLREDYVPHPAITEGMKRLGAAGMGNGATARVLFSSRDMHIGYVWFKSDFPLPLHSHDADCFYQIIAGSMRVGTEELGKGDGVLIPGGAPYTVTPGPDGVEFLEFRPTHDYDTRYRGKTDKYWDKLADVAAAKQHVWAAEGPPFDLLGIG
jgi:hypothetical protein